MSELKQKARFTGTSGAIFNIGTKSFPFGVWVECPDPVLDIIRRQGFDTVGLFEFDPPLEPVEVTQSAEPEARSRRGKRKILKDDSQSKEADE